MAFTPPLQTKTGSNASNPWTLAFPNPVGSGNLLIVVGSNSGPSAPLLVPTDSRGNTYVLGTHQDDLSGAGIAIWYAVSIAGGPNTVTFPSGSGATSIAIIAEYNLNGTLDQVAHTSRGDLGVSVTTLKPTELIVAACSNGLQPTTWSVSGGFTKETQVDASVPQPTSIVLVDRDAATIGTYTAAFTEAPLFSSDAVMLSFYATILPTKLEISLFGAKRFGKLEEAECHELPPPLKTKLFL